MQVHVHTHRAVEGQEGLAAHVTGVVESALVHFRDRITNVEVRLTDENGTKAGDRDKRCMMEAHLDGHSPIVVTRDAATVHQAVARAAEKLGQRIDHRVERRRELAGHRTDPAPQTQGAS